MFGLFPSTLLECYPWMKGGWMRTFLMWILLYWAVMSVLVASWLLLQEWECHLEDHLHRNHCSVLELIVDDDTCYRLQVSWGIVLLNMELKLNHVTVFSWYSRMGTSVEYLHKILCSSLSSGSTLICRYIFVVSAVKHTWWALNRSTME